MRFDTIHHLAMLEWINQAVSGHNESSHNAFVLYLHFRHVSAGPPSLKGRIWRSLIGNGSRIGSFIGNLAYCIKRMAFFLNGNDIVALIVDGPQNCRYLYHFFFFSVHTKVGRQRLVPRAVWATGMRIKWGRLIEARELGFGEIILAGIDGFCWSCAHLHHV